MGLFRSTPTAQEPVREPRDVEVLEQVLLTLERGVRGREDAQQKTTSALIEALDLAYAAAWTRDERGQFVLATENGDAVAVMRGAAGGVRVLPPDVGLLGEATTSRRPVVTGEQPGAGAKCERWRHAQAHGMVEAAALPLVEDGEVVGVVECYGDVPLPRFGGEKWATIGRVLAMARRQAVATHELRETADDRTAMATVVTRVGEAPDADGALRVALETVRTAFGWAYGSYWALDPAADVLRFQVESGSAGEEFRKVTLAASFAEGVGLSGRAWRARDLVFVRDLAEVTDCVRAPAAQRAGVRSGVCFPILDNGRVVGTMDFFTTETIALSASRASALRNVQALVSQRLAVLRRVEEDAEKSRTLLDTVARLREAAAEAGQVAEEAVQRASAMTSQVQELGQATAAINDVIELISGIAGQTNLLALNATIEAARAGEVGRGFAVVAQEVKDLARETAQATQRVADQVAGLQTSSEVVAAGIGATTEVIGRLTPVQARMAEVMEEQASMARDFEQRG